MSKKRVMSAWRSVGRVGWTGWAEWDSRWAGVTLELRLEYEHSFSEMRERVWC